MKRVLALALAALMAVASFSGCSKKDDQLVVYLNANFPPYEYMEGTEIKGVDIDIANEIAKELNRKLKIENADFDGILTSIASGKGNLAISGITITDDRKEQVDFSEPYTKSVQYLILPEASSIAKIEDLAGKKIGAPVGYTGQLLISDELDEGVLKDKSSELVTYKSALDASLDILNNKLDAVVMDELVAQKIAKENDGLKAIKLVYEDGSDVAEEYGVAVAKGQEELLASVNKVIERLKSEGKIDEYILNHSN